MTAIVTFPKICSGMRVAFLSNRSRDPPSYRQRDSDDGSGAATSAHHIFHTDIDLSFAIEGAVKADNMWRIAFVKNF